VPFLSVREPVAAAIERGEQVLLTGDGHYSAHGARIVAETLAAWIRAHEQHEAVKRLNPGVRP